MDAGEAARSAARQAGIERTAGRWDEALTLQRGAVALAEASGDAALHAHALRHLADILSDSGDAEGALPLFEQVLRLYADGALPPLDAANAIRGAAVNAERFGDAHEARRLWLLARDRYAALDEMFARLTGKPDNPGVAEADARLAALTGPD